MQLENFFKVSLLGFIFAAAIGCSFIDSKDSEQDTSAYNSGQIESVENERVFGTVESAKLEAIEARKAEVERLSAENERLLRVTTFYFDFNEARIKTSAYEALEAHAVYLMESGHYLVLKGYTDERGSREYNLALGERRAKAVARYLVALGVPSSQIETISYGEEDPAATGTSYFSWNLNRRVTLSYIQ